MTLRTLNLGTNVSYEECLEQQFDLITQRIAGEIPDTLLLLEHTPIYTIGRTRDQSSLLNPKQLPHPLHEISRGGQATYHGPGQLVGYPIIDLTAFGKDLHLYLRALEESLLCFCSHHGVTAKQKKGFTGIWTNTRKLASIGVGVRKWVTYHGFAINLRPESLPPFQFINPCGIDGVSMTSLESEGAHPLTLEQCEQSYPSLLAQELEKISTVSSSEKTGPQGTSDQI